MLSPDLLRRPLLILTFVLLAIFFVRPVRKWIEHRSITSAFGPNASATSIFLAKHSKSLYISNLKWSQDLTSARKLDVAVAQAWATFQPDQMLVKRFHSPKLILDGVQLHLQGRNPARGKEVATPSAAQQWQAFRNERLGQLQPVKVVAQTQSVRKSVDLIAEWKNQFAAWSDQGSQILLESQKVKTQLDQFSDNPLRHEREIISGLTELQTLSQSLERVELEIKESEKVLETQRRLLAKLKQEDFKELESVYALRPQPITQAIGQKIVHEWLEKAWREHADQTETIHALVNEWMCSSRQVIRGRDLRSAHSKAAVIAISDASARGVLMVNDEGIPFAAKGNYRCSSGAVPQFDATWRFSINSPAHDSVLVVETERAQVQTGCRLVLACYPRSTSASATVAGNQPRAHAPMFRFDCTSHGPELRGVGALDITQWLSQSNADTADNLVDVHDIPTDDQAADEPNIVNFGVHGSWGETEVILLDKSPQWVTDKLEKSVNSELFTTKQLANELLLQQHQSSLDNLNQVVAENRSSCLARSKQLRQQLLSLRNAIHRELELRSDTNFVQRWQSRATTR